MTITDGTILIGDYAIMLQNEHDLKIGQNKVFEWMRETGYLCKEQRNRPTQRSMDMGLFTWTSGIITHNDGTSGIKFTPRLTGKGTIYFLPKLKEVFNNAKTRGKNANTNINV